MRIVLPNGSLDKPVTELVREKGINLARGHPRSFRAETDCALISEVCFLRPQHIPAAVAEQSFHLGICGRDLVLEYLCGSQTGDSGLVILKDLGVNKNSRGELSVVLVASQSDSVENATGVIDGSRVLSEYPNLTRAYFLGLGRKVEVVFSHGTTEAEIPCRFRFGVCLTETGTSLAANNLRVVEVLAKSSAVLITSVAALQNGHAAQVLQCANLF